jgi:hypothetical protein
LAATPTDERYLAGGAAMHFAPNSTRYSDDLDFFHDSEARVAAAFAQDRETLARAGYMVDVELTLPGFVRAVVRLGEEATRVDWAHDSAWRFMPLVRDELGGLLLHPVPRRAPGFRGHSLRASPRVVSRGGRLGGGR